MVGGLNSRLMRNLILASLTAGALAGCAPMTFYPGPGMDASQFGPDNAQCDYIARHGGGSFVAWGSPTYVNSAMAGAALGNAIRARADYKDCMEMKGWTLQPMATATGWSAPNLDPELVNGHRMNTDPTSPPQPPLPANGLPDAAWQLREYCQVEAGPAAETNPQCRGLVTQ